MDGRSTTKSMRLLRATTPHQLRVIAEYVSIKQVPMANQILIELAKEIEDFQRILVTNNEKTG